MQPSESRKTVVDSFPSSGDDVNFYIQDNVGYLQIDRISLQNEGTYVCRGVSFDASRDLQWTTYLTVYGEFASLTMFACTFCPFDLDQDIGIANSFLQSIIMKLLITIVNF